MYSVVFAIICYLLFKPAVFGLKIGLKRVPYFSHINKRSFYSYTAHMPTFGVLRHLVTVLITDFTYLDILTKDLTFSTH